jgi:membrane protease subunit HflC
MLRESKFIQERLEILKGKWKWIVIIGGSLLLMNGAFYTIDQTELGNVRRFGHGVYPSTQPVAPGIHFKWPMIDEVDRIRVTLRTLHIPAFEVLTIDNQKVTLDTNVNFTIPREKAYHIMYEVGRSGHVDIEDQIIPVVKDRIARIFASQNMVTVNANREEIQSRAEKEVYKTVEELFGMQVHSLQIAGIRPSDGFMKSIDDATMAKNQAIAAENTKRTRQFEADQGVITAKGVADAKIEAARGEAESVRLRAESEKKRLTLEGEGERARLDAEIKSLGSSEVYVKYLQAKAALNWTGEVPQVIAGGNAGGANLVIPLPSALNNIPSSKRVTKEAK